MTKLLALAFLLLSAPAAATSGTTGLYAGKTLNKHSLPRIETVPTENGWIQWFKLEQAYVTLKPDGRFLASFKYYRQHLPPKGTLRPGPMLNETYKGSYSVSGGRITLKPDPVRGKPKPPPLTGTISSSGMVIPYVISETQGQHPLKLEMTRQGDW